VWGAPGEPYYRHFSKLGWGFTGRGLLELFQIPRCCSDYPRGVQRWSAHILLLNEKW
jgi:hypothetical protein